MEWGTYAGEASNSCAGLLAESEVLLFLEEGFSAVLVFWGKHVRQKDDTRNLLTRS